MPVRLNLKTRLNRNNKIQAESGASTSVGALFRFVAQQPWISSIGVPKLELIYLWVATAVLLTIQLPVMCSFLWRLRGGVEPAGSTRGGLDTRSIDHKRGSL
jgi:hypothetical protein